MRPSSCTASRSSASSATEASIRPREKSSMSRPCTIDHSPFGARARERGDQPFGDAVGAVGRHGHAHPVAVGGAERPVAHMVDGGVGGRRRRRQAAGLDDRRTALLHGRDEVVLEPGLVVDSSAAFLPDDLAVEEVGVLRRRVVAPDRHLLDVGDVHVELGGELADGTVVVEPGHRGESRRVDLGRVVHGDQAVGVRRVADHEDLDVGSGAVGQRLALPREDLAVDRQQVGALHPRLAGHGADEQRVVGVAERGVRVVGLHDALEERERAILQLHRDPAECVERRRDLEELEDDGLIRPQHLAGRDTEQEAVSDLPGGAGDGHANGCRHALHPSEDRSPAR